MRKGERRRADILRVSEELFYTHGYEAATIQDILDILNLSKGGFYHHFESKEQLLEAICETKAQESAEAARREVARCNGSWADKLNALFDRNAIWQDENVDFLGLLIRVAYRDDNLVMREKLKRKNLEYTLPLLEEVVAGGIREGEFSSAYPQGISRLIFQLGAGLSDEIAYHLLSSQGTPPNIADILSLLELYRHAIERLLEAPYGSIVLYQMGRIAQVCQAIWQRHAATFRQAERGAI